MSWRLTSFSLTMLPFSIFFRGRCCFWNKNTNLFHHSSAPNKRWKEQTKHRGFYMVAQWYKLFLSGKTIFYEPAQWVSNVLFLTQENKSPYVIFCLLHNYIRQSDCLHFQLLKARNVIIIGGHWLSFVWILWVSGSYLWSILYCGTDA